MEARDTNPDEEHNRRVYDDPAAIDEVIRDLDAESPELRFWALNDLGNSRHPQAVEALCAFAMAPERDEDERGRAILGLGLLGEAQTRSELWPTVIAHTQHLLKDPSAAIRCRAAAALGRIHPDVDPTCLFPTLDDEDGVVRLCAAHSLGWLGSLKAVEPLIQHLSDPQPMVRSACIEALSSLKAVAAVEALIACLQDADCYVREDAAKALCWIGDARAIGPVLAYIERETEIKPAQAAHALVGFGAAVVPVLLEQLHSPDPNLRYWAIVALGNFSDERATPVLEQLAEHDFAETRTRAKVSTAATRALKKIRAH